jgi:hypothetical protein
LFIILLCWLLLHLISFAIPYGSFFFHQFDHT